MKNIAKIFALTALACTVTLTSCMEEPIPYSSTATADQLASSSKATEALVYSMPAFFNNYKTYGSQAYDWGYGSFMHMRDVETNDMTIQTSGYNWYTSWSECTYLGPRYVATLLPWMYYYKAIQTANNTIGALKPSLDKLSDVQKGQLACGYAFRALFYLDASQWYEFLPSDKFTKNTDGNDITNLTMPIVTETTTEPEARNNPRATRAEMLAFLLSDLDEAEKYIDGFDRGANKTLPDLAAVYGLKARAYLWVEDYANAEAYARKAIDLNRNTPLTKDQWLSTTDGFNNMGVSSWMWASKTGKEDDVVQSGILNWTSWMSNEAQYGYAAAGPYSMITSELYDKIGDSDFRKLSYKAPAGSPLEGKSPVIDKDWAASLPAYTSFKFRPGQGDTQEYTVGSVCAFPVMRIEEMYLIEAEAAAHQNAARGKEKLEAFVQTYRNPDYVVKGSADVVEECINQKRIELWGEGLLAFDYKRLNMSVDRTLSTNITSGTELLKTVGRPAWMCLVIPQREVDNNTALQGKNNPDPSNLYAPVQ